MNTGKIYGMELSQEEIKRTKALRERIREQDDRDKETVVKYLNEMWQHLSMNDAIISFDLEKQENGRRIAHIIWEGGVGVGVDVQGDSPAAMIRDIFKAVREYS